MDQLLGRKAMKFKVALNGFLHVLKRELHMKVHLAAAVLVCAAAWYFELSKGEWLAVIICIASVFAAEVFNSAIEQLCDTLHPAQNKGIGLVKDMAAGAVLVMAVGAAIVGVVVFLPHVLALFH